ncbi:hypothetical protein [Streptomyces sp. NPDC058297]|uniref:hypothetical protein n=1 Tax=Streptomyces sp. NPDC058297 TaxID=3346433 RepID=UPI0036EBDCC2
MRAEWLACVRDVVRATRPRRAAVVPAACRRTRPGLRRGSHGRRRRGADRGAWDALDDLVDLVDLGLLQDGSAGRYRFHDLVRLFARDRLQEEESPAERAAVADTVTSWLLRMATMAGRWFEPGYGRPERPDPDLAALAREPEADRCPRDNVDNWMGAREPPHLRVGRADACGDR